MRTRPDCRFFQEEFNVQFSTDTFLNQYELSAKEVHLSKAKGKQTTYYFDCLTRILFIYLKNHPEVTYCQGMNELVSLIFYSFANKNS